MVIAGVMALYNKVLDKHGTWVCVSVSVILFTFLTNGSIMSNLLSNGFILIWGILYIETCAKFNKMRQKNETTN